jgi:glutamine amidotransferase
VQKQSPERTITVVDYGASNLRSVQRALEAVGHHPRVTSDPHDVERADGLVLPGVGSANDAMKAIRARDLEAPLRDYAASGRSFLGVCVGLQLLFDWSEEGGGTGCLGIVPGVVRRFAARPDLDLKVPHMGWNTVALRQERPLLEGVPDGSHFYFVHSYYAEPTDPAATLGETDYGVPFAAIVGRENVVATQFHPEKSAAYGLRLYENFARLLRQARDERYQKVRNGPRSEVLS